MWYRNLGNTQEAKRIIRGKKEIFAVLHGSQGSVKRRKGDNRGKHQEFEWLWTEEGPVGSVTLKQFQ